MESSEEKDLYFEAVVMQQVEIRVKGQIDRGWSDWLDKLAITHTSHGETVLSGAVRDQAQLRGILSRLADLGLELISVTANQNIRRRR